MTNQETIANLNMISVAFVEPVTKEQRKLIDDTFEMAIKALEQETSSDAIRRQAVLETLDDMDNALDEDRTVENYKELLKECYEVLPSVNPQPRTGHWIAGVNGHFNCSECNTDFFAFRDIRAAFIYCPYCGAKMIEPQESEVNNG